MGYGSYLIWAAPQQKVFIDPRIELYPFEQWADYINLGQANNVEQIVARYNFDAMLLSNTEQKALIEHLKADRGWVLRYADEHSSYFERAGR
jgi:hypothetical protein